MNQEGRRLSLGIPRTVASSAGPCLRLDFTGAASRVLDISRDLARHAKDVPFALFYLMDNDSKRARLAGMAGAEPGASENQIVVDLADANEIVQSWPFSDAVRSEAMQVVEDLHARISPVPCGPWSDPPRSAAVFPIPSSMPHHFAGFLVLGVSSRLPFDDRYRAFFELVTRQVATAIANAQTYAE